MMNENRKKQLLWEYKNRKPEMGIISFYCRPTGERFLDWSTDTKADVNSNRFQVSSGGHPNRSLQKLWNEHGAEAFEIEVLEVLPYDEKEENKNYVPELVEILNRRLDENEKTGRLKKRVDK